MWCLGIHWGPIRSIVLPRPRGIELSAVALEFRSRGQSQGYRRDSELPTQHDPPPD